MFCLPLTLRSGPLSESLSGVQGPGTMDLVLGPGRCVKLNLRIPPLLLRPCMPILTTPTSTHINVNSSEHDMSPAKVNDTTSFRPRGLNPGWPAITCSCHCLLSCPLHRPQTVCLSIPRNKMIDLIQSTKTLHQNPPRFYPMWLSSGSDMESTG